MADGTFLLKIINPDRIFFEGNASFVELHTSEGDVGVYPKHIPMTFIVEPGVIRIHTEEGIKEAALHAGFIEVLEDKITIMAESVEWPDEIDIARAEEAKIRAERRLNGKDAGIDIAKAELALKRSLARIQLGNRR